MVICWVLLRDSRGKIPTEALLCTDQVAPLAQIIAWFVPRRPLEVTFKVEIPKALSEQLTALLAFTA
jgi:hypothetical protein